MLVEGSLHMGDDGYPYVEGGTDGLTLDADATLAQLKEVLSGWKDGDGIESRFAVERRNRTIHKRMREYLFELTHNEGLLTSVVPLGDGIAITMKSHEKREETT